MNQDATAVAADAVLVELVERAVAVARRGDPSPAPPVGVLLVAGTPSGSGAAPPSLAEAHHDKPGAPSPTLELLKTVGPAARGATLVMSLAPGHLPSDGPVAAAIRAAGVARVVVGCRLTEAVREPDPLLELSEAGVEVVTVVAEAALDLVAPYRKVAVQGLSYLTLKLALSLDGRIATRTGQSRWITCEASRTRVHALRARHDAVMVGINTVVVDDPKLTVRDIVGRNPVRVVVDSKLRLPLECNLVKTATEVPTCVVTTLDASRALADDIEGRGIAVIRVPPTAEGRCDMRAALKELAARQVVTVLCEGGAELAGSLLAGMLADELHAFIAPSLLGPRGRPGAVDWAGPESPGEAPRIKRPRWELSGSDGYVWGPLEYPKRPRKP